MRRPHSSPGLSRGRHTRAATPPMAIYSPIRVDSPALQTFDGRAVDKTATVEHFPPPGAGVTPTSSGAVPSRSPSRGSVTGVRSGGPISPSTAQQRSDASRRRGSSPPVVPPRARTAATGRRPLSSKSMPGHVQRPGVDTGLPPVAWPPAGAGGRSHGSSAGRRLSSTKSRTSVASRYSARSGHSTSRSKRAREAEEAERQARLAHTRAEMNVSKCAAAGCIIWGIKVAPPPPPPEEAPYVACVCVSMCCFQPFAALLNTLQGCWCPAC